MLNWKLTQRLAIDKSFSELRRRTSKNDEDCGSKSASSPEKIKRKNKIESLVRCVIFLASSISLGLCNVFLSISLSPRVLLYQRFCWHWKRKSDPFLYALDSADHIFTTEIQVITKTKQNWNLIKENCRQLPYCWKVQLAAKILDCASPLVIAYNETQQ